MGAAGWVVLVSLALIALVLWRPLRRRWRDRQFDRARRDFHRQRERVELKFFRLAASSGKPRGLIWTNCDFEDDVVYVRDRRSGDLSAFVGVTISFEAEQGGGMEEVEAVHNLRAATAVFRVDHGHWSTDGRAIFNLNPTEAVQFFKDNVELVEHEVANST